MYYELIILIFPLVLADYFEELELSLMGHEHNVWIFSLYLWR